jgi:hypothetical protein
MLHELRNVDRCRDSNEGLCTRRQHSSARDPRDGGPGDVSRKTKARRGPGPAAVDPRCFYRPGVWLRATLVRTNALKSEQKERITQCVSTDWHCCMNGGAPRARVNT